MSFTITRVLGIGFITLSASALVMSCASSDNGTTHFDNGGSGAVDSGPDTSSGGTGAGGSGTGGTSMGGSGTGATGGTSSSGGTGAGGSGTGGTGAGGSGTGGSGGGSCNPAFCPTSGFGTPCCVTANGPCGVDTGTGCQQGSTGNDF